MVRNKIYPTDIQVLWHTHNLGDGRTNTTSTRHDVQSYKIASGTRHYMYIVVSSTCLSVYVSINLSMYPSICLSTYLSINLCVYQSILSILYIQSIQSCFTGPPCLGTEASDPVIQWSQWGSAGKVWVNGDHHPMKTKKKNKNTFWICLLASHIVFQWKTSSKNCWHREKNNPFRHQSIHFQSLWVTIWTVTSATGLDMLVQSSMP